MGEFDGKVVVVTGAASFVGEEIGRLLASDGASVVLADRDEDHGAAVAARLGETARFVGTDVTKDADLDRLIGLAVDQFGRLDGVVGATADFEDERLASSRELWGRVLDTNVASAAMLTTKAAAVMPDGGSIVHIASISGHVSQPARVVYNVSKAALLTLKVLKSAGLGHAANFLYMLTGEPQKAMNLLEPLLEIPYYLSPGWLRGDPTFNPLRKLPRFQALMAAE